MGPAGPVCPEWLKYGPTETITGVLASAGRLLGRRTSAWSLVPSASVIVAWLQGEPGGGGSACAKPASPRTTTAAARTDSRVGRMDTPTRGQTGTCP